MADPVKISDTSIEVDEIIPAVPEKVTRRVYERNFIEDQIVAITAQRDEMIALKESELKKCTDIIKEMDKLGIVAVAKPLEE